MSRALLTLESDCDDLITKLADVFSLPKDADHDDLKRAWAEALGSVPVEAVRTAVSVYIKTEEKYFPKPATIRRMAMKYAGSGADTLEDKYREWMRNGMTDRPGGALSPCPVCDAVFDGGDLHTRAAIQHDHQRHYEAGIEYSGPRTGPAINGHMVSTQQLGMEIAR